jgi:hypothetical protein
MAGPLDAVRQLASRVLLNRDLVPISSSPTHHADPDSTSTISLPIFSVWTLLGLLVGTGLLLLSLWQRHRRARRLLEGGQCNLPTVLWRPRFVNYAPDQDDKDEDGIVTATQRFERGMPQQKMASSTITNILPRMERLGGPYGMYGTIYGLSTRVVHVGHPLPAKTILSGLGSSTGAGISSSPTGSIRQAVATTANQKRRSTFISSSGATKAPAYNHFKNFSGDGVFTADGDDWKAKRASVIHCLLRGCTGDKSDGMRRLEREANHAVDGFIGNIERERNLRGGGQRNQAEDEESDLCLNVVPILQKSTIGLIYRFITHHDIDLCRVEIKENGIVQRDEASESHSLAMTTPKSSSTSLCSLSEEESPKPVANEKDAIEYRASSSNETTENHTNMSSVPMRLLGSYLKSVTHIRMIILAQSRSLWFLVPRWIYRVFSPMYRAEEKTMEPIRDFARAACLNAQPGSPLALLQSRPSHGSGNDGRNGGNSADVSKAMLDEAITLLFAGQDTSAATLSWTLHLLSLHPIVQKKLAKEVASSRKEQRNSNDDDGAPFFTKQSISNLPYLDAVIKESMRLYPVAPFVVRKLPQDVAIPAEKKLSAPTFLPEGSLACVWIYALHRNPRLWHRPDDFVPERWINEKLKDLDEGQRSGAFMPFANGPRNCVGQPLAHVILRIMLGRIVDRYEVVDKRLGHGGDSAIVPAMDLRKDMQAGFTVLPSGGVRLSLQRR